MLNPTDKLLVNDGTITETITLDEFLNEVITAPPVISTVNLSEDDPSGDRFTNQSFTTTVVMSEDGKPPSSKGIRAKVGNDLKYKFGPIQSVNSKTVTYSDPANFSSSNDSVRTPEDAFNGTFGTNGSTDYNFADTLNTGTGKQIQFTFPEPLFVESGVELALLSDNSARHQINYTISGVEYSESIRASDIYESGPTTITLGGGLTGTIFYIEQVSNSKDTAAWEKYIEPYLVPGDNVNMKAKYVTVLNGSFEFLQFQCTSATNNARAKVWGFWLGDHWLNDSLGATELFFDDSLANYVANVKTTDTVNEVGNGDDGVGSVAFTQYIGDELGSTQNKIVLSQIEPNWDAGSDLSSPADTAFQYLVLDNDLNVTGLQADKPDFTPFTGLTAQIQFGSNLGTADTPDTVIPEGTSIETEVQATNGINPDSTKESNMITPVPGVVVPIIGPITAVGPTTGVDYAKYVKFWDLKTDSEYTGGFHSQAEPNIDNAFDGDENTRLYIFESDSWLGFKFEPPYPITVNGLIEIKGGFHGQAPLGQLLINDVVILEFSAYDQTPKWFSTPYSGEITSIRLQQKNPSPRDQKTFSITAFKIDGEYLISNTTVTYLDFANDSGFSDFTFYDYVEEVDASGNTLGGTGNIGEIAPTGFPNRITLRDNSNWNVGSYLKKILTGYSFTPLYLENTEDVAKFNAIKESLDSYEGDRLNFRAELRKRLVENGFTMSDIYNLGLLKTEDATVWSVDTGYNQGSLVSYNDEYWFALSSSYNNSPDDNDPLDWEDLILR